MECLTAAGVVKIGMHVTTAKKYVSSENTPFQKKRRVRNSGLVVNLMYIYESHLGGLYSSEFPLDYENLHCDQCGDCDWEYGPYDSPVEFIKDFSDDICVLGCEGGYAIDCIQEICDDLTTEQIRDIALQARIENRSCVMCRSYYDINDDACGSCVDQKNWQQINV